MKVKFDFVTNSSSTSFVIICHGEPDKAAFLEAMGVHEGSPLLRFFEGLYETLRSKMVPADEAIKGRDYWGPAKSVYSLIKRNFSAAAARKARQAMEEGKEVWIGRLDSDGWPPEPFFCCESFEVDHPGIYIDALECGW